MEIMPIFAPMKKVTDIPRRMKQPPLFVSRSSVRAMEAVREYAEAVKSSSDVSEYLTGLRDVILPDGVDLSVHLAATFHTVERMQRGQVPKYVSGAELLAVFQMYLLYSKKNVVYVEEMIKAGKYAGKWVPHSVEKPLTIEGFCLFACLSRRYFHNLTSADSKNDPRDLKRAARFIKDYIINSMVEGAVLNVYNINAVKLLTGMVEKSEVKTVATRQININIGGSEVDLGKKRRLDLGPVEDADFTEGHPGLPAAEQ